MDDQQQARKPWKQAQKAEQTEKNPFSLFAKDDNEADMEYDSVIVTDLSSSDHLPKATLPRLPIT